MLEPFFGNPCLFPKITPQTPEGQDDVRMLADDVRMLRKPVTDAQDAVRMLSGCRQDACQDDCQDDCQDAYQDAVRMLKLQDDVRMLVRMMARMLITKF